MLTKKKKKVLYRLNIKAFLSHLTDEVLSSSIFQVSLCHNDKLLNSSFSSFGNAISAFIVRRTTLHSKTKLNAWLMFFICSSLTQWYKSLPQLKMWFSLFYTIYMRSNVTFTPVLKTFWLQHLINPILYLKRHCVLTYNFSNHENQTDHGGDVQFLLRYEFLTALIACCFFSMAMSSNGPLQLNGASHIPISQRQVWTTFFGTWEFTIRRNHDVQWDHFNYFFQWQKLSHVNQPSQFTHILTLGYYQALM